MTANTNRANPSTTPSSTPNIPTTIGERIRALRLRKGVTQQVVADFTFVDKATISRWEKGEREPRIQDVEALADFFKVSKSYIAFGPQDKEDGLLDVSDIPYYRRSLLEKLAEVLRGS